MKQSLKDFFEGVSIKNTLFTIIWTAGIISYTIAIPMYQDMRKQADQVWEQHIERIEIDTKKDGDKVSTSTQVQPIEGTAELNLSARPSGISEIVDKVYILESSGGKNDDCKQQGLVNGYGFRINKFEHHCYQTKAEVEKEVAAWFTKNLQNKTLAESLCYYQSGIITRDCEYARKFERLNS